jgi:hypothetical protein
VRALDEEGGSEAKRSSSEDSAVAVRLPEIRLASPEVVGEKLRVSMGSEQSKIRRTLARFDERKVPYSVAKLAELEG